MKIFKYLVFLILTIISINIYAVCPHPATYPATAYKPFPPTICYPESGGLGYCQFNIIDNGLDIKVPCTNTEGCSDQAYAVDVQSVSDKVYKNSDCTNPPLQDGCVQLQNGSIECEEEEEPTDDTVLQCTSEICQNPNNKRCPTNYVSGSVNGDRVCIRSDETPPPEPCETDCENPHDEIEAITDAKHGIVDSIEQLADTIRNSFNELINLIEEKTNSNDDDNGENTGGEYPTNIDTSALQAEMPYQELQLENASFNENIFNSAAQCPSDRTLNLDLMGRSFTYSFSFAQVCNGLSIVGLFILIMCYIYAAHLVIKE